MRSLERNKQTFYYALYLGKNEYQDEDGNYTGEYELEYDEPVLYRANISAAKGESESTPFGIETNYSKTISTCDMNCPIKEDSVIWIGKDPTTDPYNYIVVKVAKSLNSILYAIREVSTDNFNRYEPNP
jgi:hypothetical protein